MGHASGIHLLHKPRGLTSFAALQAFLATAPPSARKPPKACHGGTLDPFAEGLLLALVGQATHLFEPLHALPKVYEADLAWGVETDNGDPGGRIVAQSDPSHLTAARVEEATAAFLGWHQQLPPVTSAKKVGGEPAYRRVHRGEAVTLPPSRVYLHQARWLSHQLPSSSRVRVIVRGGFYVRAFARELGRALGTHAHLRALRRAAIGPWEDPGAGPSRGPVTAAAALPDAQSRRLSDAELGALRAGRPIPEAPLIAPTFLAPEGFPPRQPTLIAGLHRERLVALLRPAGAGLLALDRELRGGL